MPRDLAIVIVIAALLGACRGPSGAEAGPPDSGAPVGTGDGGLVVEDVPGAARGDCADLYQQDRLIAYEVEIDAAEWRAIAQEYAAGRKEYHPVRLAMGDETVDAQLRLKGNPGFSWLAGKMQFVLAFNQDDPDGRFHGLRKTSLDATWYEPTLLRDRLSWWLIGTYTDLPDLCVNSATLTVNGEYYGVYAHIEYLDHEWVERVYGDQAAQQGVLWKYGTEAVTNEEQADPKAVDVLFASSGVGALEAVGDPGQWLREWAAEAVVGDGDGYWCCGHNFYVFEHPQRGLEFVPWDMDIAIDALSYAVDPIAGYPTAGFFDERAYLRLTSDPVWGPVYVDAISDASAMLDADQVEALLAEWQGQIDQAVADDPNRSIGYQEHREAVDRLPTWVAARRLYLDSWVACAQGSTEDADLDGAPVCADYDDSDPQVGPAGVEVCDGRDQDQDGLIDDDPACDDCERHSFEGQTFLFCTTPRTWDEAQANCEAHGGDMGFAKSNGEHYFAWFHIWPELAPWWIGASDRDGDGTWIDPAGGDVSAYDRWTGGEPRGDSQLCAAWNEAEWGWSSEDCDEAHASLCRLR